MVEEIIKNARMTSSGRRILSSVQKASIVEGWKTSGLYYREFCERHNLISSQLYKCRSDAKTGAIMNIKNERDLHSKVELEMLKRENEELKKGFREINIRYQNSKNSLIQLLY